MSSSLNELLAKLTNPTPVFEDPEDCNDDTAAKLLSYDDNYDADVTEGKITSKLRAKASVLQAEEDVRYTGKPVSRKSLDSYNEDSEEDTNDTDSDDLSASDGEDNDIIKSDDEEEDVAGFNEQMKFQASPSEKKFNYKKDMDFNTFGEDMEEEEDEDEDDSGSEEDEDTDEEESVEGDSDDEGFSDEDTPGETTEDIRQFTKVNVEDEIQRGKAVKSQLAMWDNLMEGRIKLQKAVALTNQLPQPDDWNTFVENGGETYSKALGEGHSHLQKLLEQLVSLQTALLYQHPETRNIATGEADNKKNSKPSGEGSDEEITSDSDLDEEAAPKAKLPQKRKLKAGEYPGFIAKRHKDFHSYRNSTIQKWHDKTRVATGKLAKGFSEQNVLKQIDQVLRDKERLVNRTQIKRSTFEILGQKDLPQTEDKEGKEDEMSHSEQPEKSVQQKDAEIFDDDDFYHQLLRELIERKTSDITDPVALSRQWLEIEKLRSKRRKQVDTKASKGRKIRYNVHKKLVSFMARSDVGEWTNEMRSELYKSLFGKHSVNAASEKNE